MSHLPRPVLAPHRRALPLVAAALLAAPLALAQEQTWDATQDRGVPGEQLAEPPQPKTLSAGAPGEEAATGTAPSREDPGIARTRRQRQPRPAEATEASAAREVSPASETVRGRRVQLFLVPVGDNAGAVLQQAQPALEAEVARMPGHAPIDLVAALAAPPSPEEKRKVDEAGQLLADGRKRFNAHDYAEAVIRFRKAVQLYATAGQLLDPVQYAEASAWLGSALQHSGEDAAAREAMRTAARVDRAGALDPARLDPRGAKLLDAARTEVGKGPTGTLSIVTSPPGARVFLGGRYRGISPLSLDDAPVGANLVRLDRPGTYPYVQLVEARQGFDTPLKVRMSFTPEALELQRTLVQVPQALDRVSGIPDAVRALGTRFRLDRAVVAMVQLDPGNRAGVRVVVLDFGREARLADERASFDLGRAGGLEDALAQWTRGIFDKADGARDRTSRDPLARDDGTEDWYRGSSASYRADPSPRAKETQSAPARGSRSKDPLQKMDGTEDW